MKYDIFISYRRIDSDFPAEKIYKYLKKNGYRVFIDDKIKSGKFSEQLENNIQNCKDFLIIISKHSLDECIKSGDWVRREILCALGQEQNGINIIPIMMQGFNKHIPLSKDISDILGYQGVENVTVKNCSQKCREVEEKLNSKPILKYICFLFGLIFILLTVLVSFVLCNHISIDESSAPSYGLIDVASSEDSNETSSLNNLFYSNIVNGGIACYDGSRYFFNKDCLWCEDNSGENISKIYDKSVYYLNSIEAYLYFVVPEEGNAICRIKKDGTEFEKIYDNYCYELTYYNGWLYFSSNLGGEEYHVCRMRTDGSNLTILADCRVWYMSICNDKIFFCNYDDGRSIYSMNIDGSEYKLLRSGECYDLCIVNNKIFFSSDMELRRLHSIDVNGNNEEIVLNSYVRFTNYYDDKLFFANMEGMLCSCDLDGRNLSVLYNSTSYSFITLLPKKIFCNDENEELVILDI